jgi:hypothetical protein
MPLPIRRELQQLVTSASPEPKSAPPPDAGPIDGGSRSSVVPFTPAGRVDAGAARADSFQQAFIQKLDSMKLSQAGSPVVFGSLRQAAEGALVNPKLRPAEREAKLLAALEPMLASGRGPALEAIRLFERASVQLGKPLSTDTRNALAAALFRVGQEADAAGGASVETLSGRARVDPTAIRDLAQVGWVLNLGTDSQRAETVMRLLAVPQQTSFGALAARARAVVFEGASSVLPFGKDERSAVDGLMREWPTASAARKHELASQNGPLFVKLERAFGGMAAGASPAFIEEQRQRGNSLAVWVNHPRTTDLSNDIAIAEGVAREQKTLGVQP